MIKLINPNSVLVYFVNSRKMNDKVGSSETLTRDIIAKYRNSVKRMRVSSEYSNEFSIQVGIHQGLVFSLLLFTIVLQPITKEFRTGFEISIY